jgi:mevalonate kinase
VKTRGTASGKVILFGEHAVVYGVPAIAVGIDRGAFAEASPDEGAEVSTLSVGGWGVTVRQGGDEPLGRAFSDLLVATGTTTPVRVTAESDLPPGAGLGCSAALGVAVARALDPSASVEAVAERADAWERVFHGNPSGIDVAVASRGGCLCFRRDGESRTLERIVVPARVHLCIGHSGQASSTKSMVEAVARLRARRPDVAAKTFDAIHTLVKNARLALAAGDVRATGQLLDLNQMLLSGLFVSTPEIEQMCASARAAGALGAKLTGAGGGGCVVALVEEPANADAVLATWKAEGFEGFVATLGSPAIRAKERELEGTV